MQPFAEKIRILGQLRELMVYFCLQQVSFFPEVIATSKPSEMHAQNRGFRLGSLDVRQTVCALAGLKDYQSKLIAYDLKQTFSVSPLCRLFRVFRRLPQSSPTTE